MRPEAHITRRFVPLLSGARRRRFLAGVVAWIVATGAFWSWWLQAGHISSPLRYTVATLCLGWIFFLQAYFLAIARRSRKPSPHVGPPRSPRVAMVVTKTPSEPFEVVRRTLRAMLAQDIPHDTWLADEDPDPATCSWCRRHGVRISTRRGRPDYHRSTWPRRRRCKEGNLAFFYDRFGYDGYDFVAQLDADHVPAPGYLREMLRPFADPGIGYVSAPSICSRNAATSWAARSRLHNEAAFHGVLQSGYNGGLAPMCIGSHYAVRTRALREIGGLGPELAEDHSTTLMMNAHGWRGAHAIDAIAHGDGPASVADLATQEFQWSRSLVTLLLRHTPRLIRMLPWRLKLQFLFCQMIYPMFALTMGVMLALPIWAVVGDVRFAEVTYPGFLAHALPPALALLWCAAQLKREGLFRPADAPLISWEKALFLCVQWPWVVVGCFCAIFDWITGRSVDFRVTPKGRAASRAIPTRILLPYALIVLASILPAFLGARVEEARGFLVLGLLNAVLFAFIVARIVAEHLAAIGFGLRSIDFATGTQALSAAALIWLVVSTTTTRGVEGLYALSAGLEPIRLARIEAPVSGAGTAPRGSLIFRFDPGWDHHIVSKVGSR